MSSEGLIYITLTNRCLLRSRGHSSSLLPGNVYSNLRIRKGTVQWLPGLACRRRLFLIDCLVLHVAVTLFLIDCRVLHVAVAHCFVGCRVLHVAVAACSLAAWSRFLISRLLSLAIWDDFPTH